MVRRQTHRGNPQDGEIKMYLIISEGITIGRFQEKPDAKDALKKYVKNGYIKEVKS